MLTLPCKILVRLISISSSSTRIQVECLYFNDRSNIPDIMTKLQIWYPRSHMVSYTKYGTMVRNIQTVRNTLSWDRPTFWRQLGQPSLTSFFWTFLYHSGSSIHNQTAPSSVYLLSVENMTDVVLQYRNVDNRPDTDLRSAFIRPMYKPKRQVPVYIKSTRSFALPDIRFIDPHE